jgi:hypothetical protein
MEIYWCFRHDFQHAVEESKQESKSNDTIYQNCGSDIPSMLEVNHANLSGPNREQTAMVLLTMLLMQRMQFKAIMSSLILQNQTSTPQACHPSITGNKGLPVCEDNIRIPEDVWHA